MQIVTGRRGEPHVTSRQMQAVYRSFLGDFALLDVGAHLAATATSNDNVRISDGVVAVQGIYAVIAYNEYDDNYIEPVSVGMKRIDTLILHYTKSNDIEDMQIEVVEGEEVVDNPVAPTIAEGGDAWEGTADIKVPIYDVLVTSFGLTVTPYSRMNTLIPTLDSIAERIPETVVTGVKGDSEALYRNGNVNITKDNIGLGNVDNTADTDKPVSNATQTALNLKADLAYVNAGLAEKVDKVQGKGLSTNDYTNEEKQKLANIEYNAQANVQSDWNEDDTEDDGYIKNKPNLSTSLTATGNPLTIESSESNLVECVAEVEAYQDLHGYDHPWVGGAGKNKLPMTISGIKSINTQGTWSGNNFTINGVTIAVQTDADDNVIGFDFNGTSTAQFMFNFMEKSANTFSNMKINGYSGNTTASDYCIYIGYHNSSGSWVNEAYQYNGADITIATYDKITVGFLVRNGKTLSHVKVYPMIRLATETDSTFEPYSNICPISGRSEVEIDRVGVNWVEGRLVGQTIYEQGIIDSTQYAYDMCYGKVIKGVTYTITSDDESGKFVGGFFTDIPTNHSVTYDNQRVISENKTFTAPINGYVAFRTSSSDTTPQLELGNTATTYEPYAGKTYTIQLGDTIYGGELDVITGELRVNKAVVDLGQYNYFVTNIDNQYFATISTRYKAPTSLSVKPNWICDSYDIGLPTYTDSVPLSNYTIGCFGDFSQNNIVFVRDPRCSSVAEMKTALNGVKLVYELATPYTIQLTPQQIRLLKGTNHLSCTGDLSIKYYPDNVLGQLKGDIEDEYDDRIVNLEEKVDVRTAKVYSFHINDSESNPSDKVTYLDDAVGMTPAHMNFSTGKFDYGSWGNVWFVKECKPCILRQDGKVYKYLNPNNYGTDIDILDSDPYNVMIEFPKIWYKVTPDENDPYSGTVSISSVKIDEGYKDYAYIDYKGNHKEHFYMPAYNGSLVNNVIRSLSYKQVSKTLNTQTEINYCKANGSGWYTEDAGEIMLINFLLILMGKSTDMQSVYGQGLHTGGTEAINNSFTTGVHNNKGLFYGTNSGTIASGSYGNAVKVFGIENYWGFQWRRYAGDINYNGTRLIKLCYGNEDGSTSFDYDSDGTGYVNVGATPSGTSDGYISKMKFTHDGMYSQVSSGSSSTYYCDGQWFNNSQVDYAFRGGSSGNGLLVGAFCVSLAAAASLAGWNLGAAPSYK